MNASSKQPLAKGWDDILDILAAPDMWNIWALRRIYDRYRYTTGDFARVMLPETLAGIRREAMSRKQALAKGRPPIHTTTPEKRPLRRALTPPKGTT
jgi:hypothetical protein